MQLRKDATRVTKFQRQPAGKLRSKEIWPKRYPINHHFELHLAGNPSAADLPKAGSVTNAILVVTAFLFNGYIFGSWIG